MTYDPKQVVFLDTETSGLDDRRHHVWEVAIIRDGVEYQWMVGKLDITTADPMALNIGGFHQRHMGGAVPTVGKVKSTQPEVVARKVYELTYGRHIVGAVPDFDYRFLRKLLLAHGYQWGAHYHLIDVEALMAGHITGWKTAGLTPVAFPAGIPLPWKSRDLSRAVGVDPEREEFAQHTALGDARWAKACFEAVMGQPQEVQP